MSNAAELVTDAFGRINEGTQIVVGGLSPEDLRHRIAPGANPIGWLTWHLMRVQDSHVAAAAGADQVWVSAGWHKRFGLPYAQTATGYGQSHTEVDAIDVEAQLLVGYAQAVTDATLRYVARLGDGDLDRIVDESWDPPVTLGVRLVSVIGDDLKHLGQAEYVRGLL